MLVRPAMRASFLSTWTTSCGLVGRLEQAELARHGARRDERRRGIPCREDRGRIFERDFM